MLKCDNCGDSPVYKLRIEKGKGFCDKCVRGQSSRDGCLLSENVVLNLGNGQMMKASKREIDEIKRLRILQYERKGGWYPGRMGDNGKIQEAYLKE